MPKLNLSRIWQRKTPIKNAEKFLVDSLTRKPHGKLFPFYSQKASWKQKRNMNQLAVCRFCISANISKRRNRTRPPCRNNSCFACLDDSSGDLLKGNPRICECFLEQAGENFGHFWHMSNFVICAVKLCLQLNVQNKGNCVFCFSAIQNMTILRRNDLHARKNRKKLAQNTHRSTLSLEIICAEMPRGHDKESLSSAHDSIMATC